MKATTKLNNIMLVTLIVLSMMAIPTLSDPTRAQAQDMTSTSSGSLSESELADREKKDTEGIDKQWAKVIPDQAELYKLMLDREECDRKLDKLHESAPSSTNPKTKEELHKLIAEEREHIEKIQNRIERYHCHRKDSPYVDPIIPEGSSKEWFDSEIKRLRELRRKSRVSITEEFGQIKPSYAVLGDLEFEHQRLSYQITFLRKVREEKYGKVQETIDQLRAKIDRTKEQMQKYGCSREESK